MCRRAFRREADPRRWNSDDKWGGCEFGSTGTSHWPGQVLNSIDQLLCLSSSTTCVFQLKSLHADRPAVSVCNNCIYCGPKMSMNTRVRCLNVIVLDQGFANDPWFHLENLIFLLSFSIIFGRCCKESIILTVVQPYPVSLHIDYVLHVSFLVFWLIWDWLNSAEVHKLNGENTNKTSADQHYFSYFMLFYYQWYTLLYYTIVFVDMLNFYICH